MDSFNANAADVVVKVSFNGELRRFPFPKGAPFQVLREQVAAILGLEKGAELVLKYSDEEGDLITISSDWELNSAIKPGQLLRLTAFTKDAQPSAPVLREAPPAFVAPPVGGFPAGPFGGPGFPGAVPPPFGGPAGPFGGAPGHAGPFGGHGPVGPFGFPPGGAFAGGCGGWRKGQMSHEEWKQLKKEKKSQFSPEEWAKLKEERKRVCKERKEFKKNFGKFARGGHHHGHHGHPGYFGPHGGPHSHPFHHPHPFGSFGQGCDSDAEKLTARFVKDVTVEDGTHIAGGSTFVKTWRLRNEGNAWPAGCVLRLLTKHSDSMGAAETTPIPFEGPVATGTEFDIHVHMIAPVKPGRYTAYFKMCSPSGKKFGQRLWVSIVVPATSSSSSSSSEGEKEADKYEALVDKVVAMGFPVKRHRVFRLLQKFDGDVERVTQVLHTKAQKKALKEHMKAHKKTAK